MKPRGELAREPAYLTMEIRVRGRVQGVGFRPTVWRMARELDLAGEVLNDAEGVLVRVGGEAQAVNDFLARIAREPPPLARIDAIETHAYRGRLSSEFRIAESRTAARAYAGRAGRRHLRGLRGRDRQSVRAALPLSVRQLHPLRAAAHHRRRHPLRPRQYHNGAIRHVRGLRAGIPEPGRSPLSRRGDRLPCLRPSGASDPVRRPRGQLRPALDARRRRCGARAVDERRNRRRQGTGRISPRLRRDQRRGRRPATPVEGA